MGGGAVFRWVMQLHKDVPKAARFYSEGLGFTVNNLIGIAFIQYARAFGVKWFIQYNDGISWHCSENVVQKGYSSLLSFTVTDINSAVMKLMELGAELDGPIKHETHGKIAAMRCLDGHMVGLHEPA